MIDLSIQEFNRLQNKIDKVTDGRYGLEIVDSGLPNVPGHMEILAKRPSHWTGNPFLNFFLPIQAINREYYFKKDKKNIRYTLVNGLNDASDAHVMTSQVDQIHHENILDIGVAAVLWVGSISGTIYYNRKMLRKSLSRGINTLTRLRENLSRGAALREDSIELTELEPLVKNNELHNRAGGGGGGGSLYKRQNPTIPKNPGLLGKGERKRLAQKLADEEATRAAIDAEALRLRADMNRPLLPGDAIIHPINADMLRDLLGMGEISIRQIIDFFEGEGFVRMEGGSHVLLRNAERRKTTMYSRGVRNLPKRHFKNMLKQAGIDYRQIDLEN